MNVSMMLLPSLQRLLGLPLLLLLLLLLQLVLPSWAFAASSCQTRSIMEAQLATARARTVESRSVAPASAWMSKPHSVQGADGATQQSNPSCCHP